MNIQDIELPKNEAEARDHKDNCGGSLCPICYHAENLLIHNSIENLLVEAK